MDFSFYIDNLSQYMGTGMLFQLLLASVMYLGFCMKQKEEKSALVWFPVYALLIYFCPIWIVYMRLRSDGEILYRILWLIPVAVVVSYAAVQYIYLFPARKQIIAVLMVIVLFVLSGKYIYSNKQYKKAENAYHIPQVVIDICDDIVVPGREIGACFPIELVQYVRQYTAYVCQPYGRDNLIWGMAYDGYSKVGVILSKNVVDTEELVDELRLVTIPYLILNKDTELTTDLSEYDFKKVKVVQNYVVYLDNQAYIGDFSDLK